MGRRAALAAISVGALLLGAGTAHGVNLGTTNGLTYMYKSVPLPLNGTTTKVGCPGNRAVTGGGALVSDDTDYYAAWMNDSSPMPAGSDKTPDQGWIASEQKFTPARQFHVYAICSNEPSKLVYVHRKAKLPEQSSQAAVRYAPCPRGTTLAGGGAFIKGGTNGHAYLHSSSPDPTSGATVDEGWYAQATVWVSRPNSVLHVYAICSKQVNKYEYVIEQASIPATGDHQAVEVANCPGGTAVSGGGARTTQGPDDARLHSSSPQPAAVLQRPDKGWIGTAEGYTTVTQDLVVYAICKK